MTCRVFLRPVALLVAVALAGCGGFARDKETAAKAMDAFHDRYNDGDYGKIYDAAGPDFQAKTIRGNFLALLDAVHRKLGGYRTCENQGWKSLNFNGNSTVELHYRTHFEKGEANEEFVYAMDGTRAVLRSYRIDANALITQ